MIYVSFLLELMRSAISDLGMLEANICFFIGIILMMAIDFVFPHKYLQEKPGPDPKKQSLYSTGLLTAAGIAIHNFPEGMAVFASGLTNMKRWELHSPSRLQLTTFLKVSLLPPLYTQLKVKLALLGGLFYPVSQNL